MHLFQLAHSHLGDVGHQVVGDAVGILADQAALVGTDGVEVAQQRHIQAGVCMADVLQNALGESLGGAVGVGGSAHGEVLGDGHTGGIAVDGSGGAEHEVVAVMMAHHVQNDQRAVEVIIVVLDGLGHALAHSLVGCKLDDGGDVRALGEDLLHILMAGHVCIVEAEVLAGDLLDPIQNHGRSVIIVICHYDIVASVQQFDAGVAADVAGTAGNQNCHSRVPLSHSISYFFSLRRALPGLLKEYRFLPPTARGAFFIQIYFCCIFVQYTFD